MSREFPSITDMFYTSKKENYLEHLRGNASDCTHSQLPSAKEYYQDISLLLALVIAVSTVAVVVTCALYVASLWHVVTRAAPTLRSPTGYVLTIHPVAALASYISVVIPRTYFLMEALVQDLFTICVYQMFCLLAAYCEEEDIFNKVRGAYIHFNTGPCCCLPCCRHICKPVPLTRKTMMHLRILVLQLPVVLWIMYGICYILWAEDEKLLDAASPYLVPVQLGSCLLAAWGTKMVGRALSESLSGVKATHKFLALELTVLLPEILSLVAHHIAGYFPCSTPFTPLFWSNLVVNVLTLLEVLALSLWARSLYCREGTNFQKLHNEHEDSLQQGANIALDDCKSITAA